MVSSCFEFLQFVVRFLDGGVDVCGRGVRFLAESFFNDFGQVGVGKDALESGLTNFAKPLGAELLLRFDKVWRGQIDGLDGGISGILGRLLNLHSFLYLHEY